MENENQIKCKNRNIIILLILIIILAIIYCLYVIINNNKINNKTDNETKIIEFLQERYADNEFEIIEKTYGRQCKTQEIGYDGLVLIPARKIRGKYEYLYKVLSVKDNVKFDIYYLNDNGNDSYQDSYMAFKNVDNTNEEIANYILKTLGHQNVKVESNYDYTKYDSNIDIYIDENIQEILDQEYINCLYDDVKVQVDNIIKDFNYLYSDIYNVSSWGNMKFEVNIHYKDNKYIHLHPEGVNITIWDENQVSGQNLKNYFKQISE